MSKFLLENDHSVLDEDFEKNVILHIAAKVNEAEIAELVVKRRRDELKVKNIYGETPLYVAVLNNSKTVTEYLLEVDGELEINNKYTDEQNTLLHVAVENNDIALTTLLIKKGHSVNIKNTKGQTPLHIAIAKKYREILFYFINEKLEIVDDTLLHYAAENNCFQLTDFLPIDRINERNSNGHTPLYLAVKNQSKQMFDFLISNEVNIEDLDEDGNSLLHCAAFVGNLEAVVVLLKKGLDKKVNDKNLHNETPLHRLIARPIKNRDIDIDIIKVLLHYGHTYVKDENGNTLLHFAAKINGTELAKILIKKNHPPHIPNNKGQTPLHVAIDNVSTETIKFLLNSVENNVPEDNNGNTLLHYAVERNDIETVSLLIFKKHKINDINRSKETPVHLAIKNGNCGIFKFLLTNGADTNVLLKNGNTILHFAAEINMTDLAVFLITKGLSVNCKNSKNQTPLHLAIKNNSINTSIFLLSNKHDMTVKDIDGDTLLHYAAQKDDTEIAELLLKENPEINEKNLRGESALHTAAKCVSKKMINFLLKKNPEIEAKDINGNTLLHLAAKTNNTELALLLIEKNLKVDAINSNKETPLFWSVSRKFKNMTKLLLEKNHQIHHRLLGNTLLHTAVSNDDVEIAALLIEHGLDINVRNDKNETPFHYAVKHKRKFLTNFLFNHENFNRTINAEIAVLLVKSISYIKGNIKFSVQRDVTILRYNRMSTLLLNNPDTIEIADENGNTLLHLASETNDVDLGDLLIRNGHGKNVTNKFGMTPLYVASINDSKEMCRFLLEQDQIDIQRLPENDRDLNINSLLHLAIEQNDLKRVDLLLKKGHDVNSKNSIKETPLRLAFKNKFGHIVVRLLQQDEIVLENIADEEGNTLLHIAAEENNIKLANLLLKKGQKTDIRNVHNDTPLHVAFRLKYDEMSERLLSNDTKPDFNEIIDKKGNTLMHFAVEKNNLKLVQLLIKKKHAINVANVIPETPVHIAFNKRYTDILKILLKHTNVDFKDIVDKNNIKLLDFAEQDAELNNILLKTLNSSQ